MANVKWMTVRDLFGRSFFVPSYQRGYRWNDVQVGELLADLYDFAENKGAENSYYCLQPIIVKNKGEIWELVDGQQRLTALWLLSALYYCSNRDDIVGLERYSYSLEYQEKELFTRLFEKINAFVEKGSMRQISDAFEADMKECIDSRHLIESMIFISRYERKGKTAKGVLAKIFEVIDSIRIIWYELDGNEDPIQTFTNINANKIELTNSELIKAVMLRSCLKENERDMALQWEAIEKGLNNDSLWFFIVNDRESKYSTRIDYLFEIWAKRNGREVKNASEDRYDLFRNINHSIEMECSAEDLWKEIQEIYDTMIDWYNDCFYYHKIGLLIVLDEKNKSRDIVNELYSKYSKTTKHEFKNEIDQEIMKYFFSKSNSTPFEVFSKEQIENDMENIVFSDKDKVKKVLLLYNIAMLLNANNTYERFPFDLYKQETWDIEHINPQTPKDATEEEMKAWLDSYKSLLGKVDLSKDETLIDDICECIDNHLNGFDEISIRITQILGIVDNDSISNLVLLDAKTNRGYKNACFSEKRKEILDIERNCESVASSGSSRNKENKRYIPIGTKWVFLKGYENAESLIVWGAEDMKDYTNDIAKNIFTVFGGKINE